MDNSKKNLPNKWNYLKRTTLQGITLIEILLILILLAILTAVIVRIYWEVTAQHTIDKTRQDILTIENGLKFYKLDNGFYPTTAQGIAALVIKPTTPPIPQHWKPYLNAIPVDQQGHPYHYENPGQCSEFDVYSEAENRSSWWGKTTSFFSCIKRRL